MPPSPPPKDSPAREYWDLFDQAPIAYLSVGADETVVHANRAAAEFFACDAKDLVGNDVLDLYAPGPRGQDKAQDLMRACTERGRVDGELLKYAAKDGSFRWGELTAVAKRDEDGNVVASRSLIVDVTGRHLAEEAGREARTMFASLLEAAPDGMVLVDSEGTITLVNEQVEQMFGAPRERIVGRQVEVLIPERFRKRHVGHRDGYMADPHTRPMGAELDLYGLRADGSEFPVEISLSPVELEEGKMVVAAVRDITERKEAEEKRRSAQRMFESLLDAAPDGMVIVDENGTVTLVNTQAERMFGYTRDEMVGSAIEKLVPRDVRERHIEHRDGYMEDPRPRPMGAGLDLHGLRQDGTEFPVEISLSPVELEHGRVVIAAVRDISERRAAERREAKARQQQLEIERLKERDAFKTQFINNAAHELNTPLTTLLMQLRILKETGVEDLGERQQQSIEMVERNAKRFARLVQDLLDAGRYQGGRLSLERQRFDLSDLVRQATRDHAPAANDAGLDLASDVADGIEAHGDPDRLRQVLDNLVGNAIKFTPQGKNVSVSLGRDGREAVLEVADTGRGFEPEDAKRLFQPFMRLDAGADAPPGTGLGLYLCHALVELHHGTIAAASKGPGQGATFTVRLPLA